MWRALPIQGRYPVFGQVSSGPDDRFYVGLFRPDNNGRSDLWSVSMSDPADVRDEHLVVGAFNVTGDLLTWTDGGDGNEAPTGHVHVRNLVTGDETSFDPQPGDRCSQQSLRRTERYIVLGQNCSTLDIYHDNWFQIFTADGDPVVTVRDDGIDAATVSNGAVTLNAPAAGELQRELRLRLRLRPVAASLRHGVRPRPRRTGIGRLLPVEHASRRRSRCHPVVGRAPLIPAAELACR